MDSVELTIVMPCLNEAETVAECVRTARGWLDRCRLAGEVVVADNGSTDGSQALAREAGARVVDVPFKGYGSALMGGIQAAHGRYVIMGDTDGNHDLGNLDPFLDKLREGFDLVVGNRFKGGIAPGSMSRLNQYVGNPVLSFIGRLLFPSPAHDFHCGLRAFRRDTILGLDLRTTGMEFASEMIVKATLNKLKIAEVPTRQLVSGRSHAPHLRPFRDGWRHLRFLLLYSPRWLFLYPGVALMTAGGLLALLSWSSPALMLLGTAVLTIGFQAALFAAFTKIFATYAGLMPQDPSLVRLFDYLTLERGILFGAALSVLGVIGLAAGLSGLTVGVGMQVVIAGAAALALGAQIVLSSFFFSILGLRRK